MRTTGDRRMAKGARKTALLRLLSAGWLALASGLSPLASYAAFRDQGWGTRAAGMGGAFTAVSDDSNALAYNPAGLARLGEPEVSLMYAKPFVGLDLKSGADGSTSLGLNHFAAATPAGGFASWSNFNASGLYSENTYTLGYGKSLGGNLMAGLNLKSMSTEFTLDDFTKTSEASSARSPFRDDTSASAVSVDAGLLARPAEPLWVGLAVRNLNSPDIGLAQEDRIPREVRLGAAWTVENLGPFQELTSTLEFAHRKPLGNPSDTRALFGVESWFRNRAYAARMGGNDRELAFGGSYNQDFRRFELRLDYAFVWSTVVQDSGGTHRLSLTLKGGGPARAARQARKAQPELKVLAAAGLALADEDWAKAETLYGEFLRDYPEHKLTASVNESLGQVQLIQEKWEAAEDTFVRILSRYPASAQARNAKTYLHQIYQRYQQASVQP
jgi:hypothetical protein